MFLTKLKSVVSSLDEAVRVVQTIEPLADGASLPEIRDLAGAAEALVLALVPAGSRARPTVSAAFGVMRAGIDVAHDGATGEEFTKLLSAVEALRASVTKK